jgi:ferritin-like metal-binding protein YciE
VEHFEISVYGTLHALALQRGEPEEAAILAKPLKRRTLRTRSLTIFDAS